ncbi:MAG: hypothetical protein KKE16_07555 [Firmicutes bacterium]|nr:hypothetical protein [Bacillota bacterium]
MTEFGYDFSKIRNLKMTRKNYVVPFLMMIFFFTPFIIFSVFFGLYLTDTPMEINEVVTYPGSMVYENFMITFLLISGGISLAFILPLLLSLFSKNKDIIYLGETVDLERIVYVESKNKSIYVSPKTLLIYDKKREQLTKDSSLARINEYFSMYIFWLNLDQTQKLKIKATTRKIVYSYKEHDGSLTLQKRYALKLDDSGQLIGFSEQVSTYRYGNSNIKAMNHFQVIETNGSLQIPYHSKISRELINIF